MEYTKEETLFIQVKKPEFRVKPVPSLDAVIVEFLKKYEVFVQPISSGTRNVGESAVAGAITGMAGADVGGDAFMISGQNKQTKVQEWTQWKQWALDHKDFEAFKTERIDKAKEHNAEVDKKLKDPAIQKQLEPVMEEFKKEKENERKITLIGIPVFLLIFIVIPLLVVNYTENRDEDSSFNSIIKNEKITEIIS